ncbi:hypothetical protein GCM10012320_32170 [Sinomonas cellulolyticus]|uniref:DUF4440 domain-containing protein n=1 Tax=Sinomonas cellulolyticus TaxID=2801916 RepID=A0ABS1JYD9_9MICC|nr:MULTISPECIES: hypothetical protein [Sinomonas]MBL0704245.1 hypothetical protein [Sinomonas cellulolyticus]GHG58508.1 hypothetical protein GCM10012320_32170 [Sinomonas sp. KCTC 49339]
MNGIPVHPEDTEKTRPGHSGLRGADTLGELSARFTEGYRRTDSAQLAALYLPSARVWLGEDALPLSPEAGIEDRLRLGLPLDFTVRQAFEDGARAHVRLTWTVEGTTPDGTALAMAGSTSLDCERRNGRWFIASEWTRHGEQLPTSSS